MLKNDLILRNPLRLMQRVQQHMGSMDRFAAALEPLATKPEVAEVLAHTIDGTRSINTLLKDLLALAEHRPTDTAIIRSGRC